MAVDHPGNNSVDEKTVAGAVLWWDRTEDLRAALAAIARDPAIGPHINLQRVGAAGFSAGGFTVLVAAGARADRAGMMANCRDRPDAADRDAVLARPEIAAEVAHASDDHALSEVRAVFALAPGLVRALDPGSLARMRIPVAIMLGEKGTVAPPVSNGLAAARLIPNTQLSRLPGVGHYDFLASCTAAGRLAVPQCRIDARQSETHAAAIEAAVRFFDAALQP